VNIQEVERIADRSGVACASAAAMDGPVTQPLGYAEDQQKASEGKAHERNDQGKPSTIGAGAGG